MTNNPNGFQRDVKIKGQRLEEVENFKYLWAIISNEGSKPEILSRVARQQQLFLDWRSYEGTRTSRLLLRLSWCGRSLIYLPLCLWELDINSRNREKDPSPWDEMLYETSESFLQRPCDERGGSQQNPESNWSAWWSPNHGKETETQMVWSHLEILWHGEDNSAKDNERSKKMWKTGEEMGR